MRWKILNGQAGLPLEKKMNYPAAISGVSRRTETFGAASGGDLDPSRRRRDQKFFLGK
jgi:hypothetical protein